jgi:hypothetical protein
MEFLISYVIEGNDKHKYESEIVDIKLPLVMYSFQINEKLIEPELVKWVNRKQALLKNSEKIILLKTLHV